ncbi:MAG: hypothetical protein A3H98_00120 [Bacteroidetes bacterium RIFCSPLOWO2_02_FULL_36_8]|nr:MAG: hypothetical protein A3H98_00120 [Bacteroidetes bacterium RIFCSPLOWO2_02_FULL_36_8]
MGVKNIKNTMNKNNNIAKCHYLDLAQLFRYPGDTLKSHAEKINKLIQTNYFETSDDYAVFLNFVNTTVPSEIEELYISTFDVQAICFLDIGYVLFGEDYKRGAFLVKMNEEQRRCGNECGKELADHLPNVLTLLSTHPDPVFVNEFVNELFFPAVTKMLATFKEGQNPYKYLFITLKFILQKEYTIEIDKIPEIIQNNLKIENCLQCHCAT